MRLILTRHGETEENRAGIIQGHLPGKLSSAGMDQAKKVALRLKDEKIDYIYSSDLARAADTAKEIARFHPNTKLELIKELRERHFGDLQGTKSREIKDWKRKKYSSEFIKSIRGELPEEFHNRAKDFLNKTLKKNKKGTILFVGHNGINKAVIASILDKSTKELKRMEKQKNTAINIFKIQKNSNKEIIYNCTKHLD